MSDPHVQSIVANLPVSAGGLGAIILPPPSSPMAVARELVRMRYSIPGHRLLHHWRGGFNYWKGTHWIEMELKEIRSAAWRFTEHALYLNADGEEVPWKPSTSKINNLLDATQAICHLSERVQPPRWLEKVEMPPAGELVSVANGLLHVSSRELYSHDPRLFNQVAVPFDYAPDALEPTQWLDFLEDLWGEDTKSIEALQEFFGYAISGLTHMQKMLLLVGPRRGGKGTIARILTDLIGKANVSGPTLASLGTNFGLQNLIGKPLAIISDARLDGRNANQVVERLLSISGEDTLTIDRKYRDHWTGPLPTRFMVVSNELPRFGDASGAIATRFVLLTLTESFLGREDHNLSSRLRSELPGILNWALDGLDRLRRQDRFTVPESSRDAVTALEDLVSAVAAFVRDRCDRGPLLGVSVDDIYGAFRHWAEENGQPLKTKQVFGRDLRAAVPGLRLVRPREGDVRERRYSGLALVPTMGWVADR